MAKRYRRRKCPPGTLMAYYGKMPGDSPDLIIAWGDGVPRCDHALLHYVFASHRMFEESPPLHDEPANKKRNTFFDELLARGYDPGTFEFRIRKLTTGTPDHG